MSKTPKLTALSSGFPAFLRRARPARALALTLLLGACAATPPEPPLKVAMPAAYSRTQGDWQPAQHLAATPRGPWWHVFDDPVLNER